VEPGRKERLLDRIGGIDVAAQDQPGGAMESIDGGRSEGRERVMIAAPGANDVVSLHREPALAAARWPRSTIMSLRTLESFEHDHRVSSPAARL
jgi:hypothetical protein